MFMLLEWRKGHDPINQIVGYVLSGDPAYALVITMHEIKSVRVMKLLKNCTQQRTRSRSIIYENYGIDVGSKIVGVAISDPLGFTAQTSGLWLMRISWLDRIKEFGWQL